MLSEIRPSPDIIIGNFENEFFRETETQYAAAFSMIPEQIANDVGVSISLILRMDNPDEITGKILQTNWWVVGVGTH